MVFVFNSYRHPELPLIFLKHCGSVCLKSNFTDFLFHRKLAKLSYAYWELHFKLLDTYGREFHCLARLRSDSHPLGAEVLSSCGWNCWDNHSAPR